MKTIHKILGLLLVLVVAAVGCSKDYDMPPLNKPVYTGPEENITIKELKENYKNVAEGTPQLIEFEYILKARVISSDASGNIFKQVYIEDHTGGINLGADQNNISTDYALGQEVYINLHGLYMVSYGEQLQIGYGDTQANRIPWNIFTKHVVKNNWPNVEAIKPTVVTDFSKLSDKDVNTLVELEGIYFTDGGKLPYAEDQKTVNRNIKDSKGNTIILRTSGYSNFYKEILPFGTGSVVGILSKHRSDWQLMIRSLDDVLTFDGKAPGETDPTEPTDPEDPNAKPNMTIAEFAAKYAGAASAAMKIEDDVKIGGIVVSDDTDSNVFKKVYIEDETGGITVGVDDSFVSKTLALGTKVVFNAKGLDAIFYEGLLQIGSSTAQANRISLADFESRITTVSVGNKVTPKVVTIETLNSSNLNTLVQLSGVTIVEAGQPYANPKVNTNRTIKDASGKTLTMRNSGFSKFADQIMPSGNLTIVGLVETHKGEWQMTIRSTSDVTPFNGEVPTDPTEPTDPTDPVDGVVLKESFGAKFEKGDAAWPKIAAFTGYDDKAVVYSDPTNVSDIRNTKDLDNHVWLKANADSEFVVAGLVGVGGKELSLSYAVAANVYNETDATNLNSVEVWYNGKQLTTESKEVKGKADLNKFYTLSIKGIQGVDGAELKFVAKGANNKFGLRLDNLEVSVK